MTHVLNKIKSSKLAQRLVKLGLAYVCLEITLVVFAIFFVAQEVA